MRQIICAKTPARQWAASPAWPLKAKMTSDFDATFLARLDTSDGLVRATERLRGTQTTLAVGYKPVGAVSTAAQKTNAALGVGRFLVQK
ncbi:MAG: hypothetical protein ABI972_20715 [Acidobacteriota bacterium]